MTLHITGDNAADTILSDSPFALLTGMLLDQQVTMETAFAGPEKLVARLGDLTPASIAAIDSIGAATPKLCGPRVLPLAPKCCGASRPCRASGTRKRRSSWPSWASNAGLPLTAGVKHPLPMGKRAAFAQ